MTARPTPTDATDGSSSVEPAGKPLRADAKRNRAKVLDAARTAFATDGLAVPLDEIARRAGVGAGTVYRHFPTKEALFEAVVLHRITDHIAQARQLALAPNPGAAFYKFLNRLIEDGSDKRDLVDALTSAGVSVAAIADTAERLNEAVAVLLKRAQQAGVVRVDLTITELMALLTAVFLAVQRKHADSSLCERVWAVVFDGLHAKSAGHAPRT